MPRKAKPLPAQRHSHDRQQKNDDDSDSGPDQTFRRSASARSQPRIGRITDGQGAQQQRRTETPEQRMLRRMEAGSSDGDSEDDAAAASHSLQGAFGSDDDGGSELLSDDAAARASGMDDDSSADSQGRDGDSGASSASDDDIADVPFEELAAGRAVYGSAAPHLHGGRHSSKRSTSGGSAAAADAAAGAEGSAKGRKHAPHRENKNRPAEQSSKRPVGRLRDVVQAPKTVGKDPRFEALSGAFNADRFRKQYSFVFDEQLPAEKSSLKAAMKKVRSADKREALAAEAARIEGQLREDAARQKKRKFEQSLKAKEREAVKAGKKPFFLKKSAKRQAELVAKYEELKASGRLEKYMAKRRRKNAAKDHRYIPGASRAGE